MRISPPANWDAEVDVLCIGSGAGGMSAAIAAAEAGASVLVVEKDKILGGVTGMSSGQCWLGNNSLAEAEGFADSREETLQYLEHLSQGLADPRLRDVFIDKGREVIDFLATTIGIPFYPIKHYPDYYYPAVQGAKAEGRYLEVEAFPGQELGEWAQRCVVTPWGHGYAYTSSQEWTDHQGGIGKPIWTCLEEHLGKDERLAGAGLAAHLLKAALDRGVEFWLESAATHLIAENGELSGVQVSTSEGEKMVRVRKGAVLATGGYDWNKQLVSSFESLPEAASMCPPTVTGDHLLMAAELGAIPVVARRPAQNSVFIGYRVPGEIVYGHEAYRMIVPGHPHSCIVNRAGKRFANDSFYPDVATKVGRFDGQEEGMVNWPAWLVFDQDMLDKYGLMPFLPGQALSNGMAHSADSIAGLADAAGINVDGLTATIARFNAQCETGDDIDFGRGTVPWGRMMTGDSSIEPNANMAALLKAPFYAVKLARVVMGTPTAGLRIDHNAQVIDARGDPISSLYAAGNAAAWSDIGGGYNSGIANTRGLVHGYVAARAMLNL